MNLYREVKDDEIIDNIRKLYEDYEITAWEDKVEVERAVKLESNTKAKRVIRTKLNHARYQGYDVVDLFKELDKLYTALALIHRGQKIYTDLQGGI